MWETERTQRLLERHAKSRFAQLVLPHLDGAFNLACWLLLDRRRGEDVVQTAVLDACRTFDGLHGDARVWFLHIVHETSYRCLEKNRAVVSIPEFENGLDSNRPPNPEDMAAQYDDSERVMRALESLPVRLREMILLREVEGCSYREIAEITGVPAASVMSTLCQARKQLQRGFPAYAAKEA